MDLTVQYYDLVLAAIGASLVLGLVVGAIAPVEPVVSVVAFGLVGIALIGHALFVNGPVDEVDDLSEEVALEELPLVE